jgi:DNA-binding NarL/FixJ family response regulator
MPREDVRRVVPAIPDSATAEGLQRSLESAGFAVSVLAATAAEAVEAVPAHRPRLCLLASELARQPFLTLDEIARASPETCLVLLAQDGDPQETVRALQAGAAGYVPATWTGKKWIESLELILAGYTPVPQEVLADLY